MYEKVRSMLYRCVSPLLHAMIGMNDCRRRRNKRVMYLCCRQLSNHARKPLKKVVEKFGGKGNLVVPLQPQTGNGGSRG